MSRGHCWRLMSYRVVKKFSAAVQEKALGSDVLQSITPGQQFVKLVYDELASLMGVLPVKLNCTQTGLI